MPFGLLVFAMRMCQYKYMKRLIDIMLSSVGIIIGFPVIVVFSLLIIGLHRHNPFFVTERIGRNSRMFPLFKLKSMVDGAHFDAITVVTKRDPRVTAVGRIIRRYKIDEFPQFFNVMIGDMSVVGPRPEIPQNGNLFNEAEREMFSVKPGLTGISSIFFFRQSDVLSRFSNPQEAYHRIIRPSKAHFSLFYVFRHNLTMDVELIVLTFVAIFNHALAIRILRARLIAWGAPEQLLDVFDRALAPSVAEDIKVPGDEYLAALTRCG